VSDATEDNGDKLMTVDELARRTGMTVRNVRAHQSRGLLPAPEIRARTGYYGTEHVKRLELIRELQAGGLSLKAVARVLENTPGAEAEKTLDFTRALVTAFEEEPEIVTLDELADEWGNDPDFLKRVRELGIVAKIDDETWEVRSPRLRRASREIADLGISQDTALEIVALLKKNSESISRAYVDLFLKEVWRPFQEDEAATEEGWPEVNEALERRRPLASQSLVAVFQLVMADEIEEALGRELRRMAKSDRGSRKPEKASRKPASRSRKRSQGSRRK